MLVVTEYSLFERVRLAVEVHRGEILDEEFAADVTVTARFPVERVPAFQEALQELSNGTIEAVIVATDPSTIMPLPQNTKDEQP
jgi:putative IMPACT (imprinted ancient) family translation regulator